MQTLESIKRAMYKLDEVKSMLVFDFVYSMTDEQLKEIPVLEVSREGLELIASYSCAISLPTLQDVTTVYIIGGTIAILKLKES
jgi:hypothetical protein